jgi:hypothetical protein
VGGQTGGGFLKNCLLAKVDGLPDMDDTVGFGDVDKTLVGFFLAADDSKKRGFTVTVASDESQAFTGIELKSDGFEQDVIAEPF